MNATDGLPTLSTERLRLRPFAAADAPAVQRVADDAEIARMTLSVPHPYPDGRAATWIAGHAGRFERGEEVVFAIVTRTDDELVGAIGLALDAEHGRGELGYWVARAAWGRGYATEAAARVLDYGFDELGLHRVQASHFPGNEASARVMEKIGMVFEGTLRQHYKKLGVWYDALLWAVLADDPRPPRAGPSP